MASYFGKNLRVSVFGQSHAEAIGVTVDGFPAGEKVDLEELKRFLGRRAPGRDATATSRKEADTPRILCGLVDDTTCGAPLAAMIENTNVRAQDYDKLRDLPRPGHADYTAQIRYGGYQDIRGGGHFSGRLTAPLCIAGGIAIQILRRQGIEIAAHIRSVGGAEDRPFDPMGEEPEVLDALRGASFPVLTEEGERAIRSEIMAAKAQGDSVGGIVECIVTGVPAGVGDPMFNGMEGRLAQVLFGIPAVKGVEFGAGFEAARLRGSENNDPYTVENGVIKTERNRSGGILGGITNGMPVLFRVAFKPTPSIAAAQDSVNLSRMEGERLEVTGRHDPCIVPRAVPVVEASAALVVLDALLDSPACWNKTSSND